MSEELTTFEKNYKEWKNAHPTRSPDNWVATTDRREAAEFISSKAEKIRETQLQAADDIIIGQEQTRKEIKNEISSGVDDIVEGLEGMRSTFDWGFSEIVWQIEKQRETLEEILERIQNPLEAQAKELKDRAEIAYEDGLYDDALRDFLQSAEKNPYDFTVYQTIGNIHFFHKENPQKAIEYYQKAVKYAEPKSPYHASYALLHIAQVKYLQENFNKAYEATEKALDLTPEFYETHYQHSRYCAKLGQYEEAVRHLIKAINSDKNYVLKATSEKDFAGMRGRLREAFEILKKGAKKRARKKHKKLKEVVKIVKKENLTNDSSQDDDKIREIEKNLRKIKDLQTGGLYDCKMAEQLVRSAAKTARTNLVSALEEKKEDPWSQREPKKRIEDNSMVILGGLTFVLLAFLSIKSMINGVWAWGIGWIVIGFLGVHISSGIGWLMGVILNKTILKPWVKRKERIREKELEKRQEDRKSVV